MCLLIYVLLFNVTHSVFQDGIFLLVSCLFYCLQSKSVNWGVQLDLALYVSSSDSLLYNSKRHVSLLRIFVIFNQLHNLIYHVVIASSIIQRHYAQRDFLDRLPKTLFNISKIFAKFLHFRNKWFNLVGNSTEWLLKIAHKLVLLLYCE